MTKIIHSHNKYVASKKFQANQNLCNCQNPDNCPVDDKCLTSKIVYFAEIITDCQRHQNFILEFAKQSLKLGLTITKSLSVIGRMKNIQKKNSLK